MWELYSSGLINSNGMGECKNVVKGDDYGCQKFEPSSNDPLLCGCCHCHKHFHVRPKNESKSWTMSKET